MPLQDAPRGPVGRAGGRSDAQVPPGARQAGVGRTTPHQSCEQFLGSHPRDSEEKVPGQPERPAFGSITRGAGQEAEKLDSPSAASAAEGRPGTHPFSWVQALILDRRTRPSQRPSTESAALPTGWSSPTTPEIPAGGKTEPAWTMELFRVLCQVMDSVQESMKMTRHAER